MGRRATDLSKPTPSRLAPTNHSGATTDGGLVELWLARHSEATQRAYRYDVATLTEHTGKPLSQTRLTDLQSWADSLVGAQSSIIRRISAVKSLFSFAQRTGYLDFNVGAALLTPKADNELAERILSEEETTRLLLAGKTPRDRALIRLLYVSGARVSEACKLKWKHLKAREDGQSQVTLHGKNRKTRHVLLTPRVTAELMALRPPESSENASVFLSRTGKPLGTRDAHRVLRRTAKAAGLNKDVSPHWMRHAHASHSLDRGAPISLVQADLGHASVATTGMYLHAKPNDGSSRYLQA